MPLYDFRCRSCDHRFEALVLGSDQPECPQCGGQDLEKLPSSFAVHGSAPGGSSSGSACGGCAGGNCSSCR
ncbi:MAG TPA: zinc ribbon domain-containing protein [Desulfobacterales bacterium]|nr:zinc ribbon domain-containing protein [Desulfobacterales bacterium]